MVTEFWFFWMLVFLPHKGLVAEVHAYPSLLVCQEAHHMNTEGNLNIPGLRVAPECIHVKARPGEFDDIESMEL